jgi:hypothetical protein
MVCKGFGPDFLLLLKYNDMQLSCIFEKKKKITISYVSETPHFVYLADALRNTSNYFYKPF